MERLARFPSLLLLVAALASIACDAAPDAASVAAADDTSDAPFDTSPAVSLDSSGSDGGDIVRRHPIDDVDSGPATLERIALDTEALERTGIVDLDVGENAVSLLFTVALEDGDSGLGITRVTAPDGSDVYRAVFEDDSWEAVRFASDFVAEPLVGSGDIALFLPTASGDALVPGTWRIELETDPPDARVVHATGAVRTVADDVDLDAVPHAVDVHVHVVLPETRYRREEFGTVLDGEWRVALDRVLLPHALRIGTLTHTVSSPRETARLGDLDDEREIAEACRVVRRAGNTVGEPSTTDDAPALHVGLVRTITSDGAADYTLDDMDDADYTDDSDYVDGVEDENAAALTGLSPQPGLPFDDESPNACVLVAEGPWREGDVDGKPLDERIVIGLLAANLLHELGHFAGLAHPSEADGATFDLLDDTPRCTFPDAESCGVEGGADNLMFHSGDERTLPWTLTPDQARVLRVHPLFRPVGGTARRASSDEPELQ